MTISMIKLQRHSSESSSLPLRLVSRSSRTCWSATSRSPVFTPTTSLYEGSRGKTTFKWLEELVEPVLKKMLNLKISKEIPTGKETLSITFLAGDLTKKELFVKDFTRNVDVFKKGSFADLNKSNNYISVPAKLELDVDWLLSWLDGWKSKRRGHGLFIKRRDNGMEKRKEAERLPMGVTCDLRLVRHATGNCDIGRNRKISKDIFRFDLICNQIERKSNHFAKD